jgi:methylmalonyl-CoA/ethylmalonyl-CoA epimerase
MSEKSLLSYLEHIGVIVRDIDEAIKHYRSAGINQFNSCKLRYNMRELWGEPIATDVIATKMSMAEVGSTKIELVQPIADCTHWMEFLETRGEGIQHLGFYVDDIDKAEAELTEKGFKLIYRSRFMLPDNSAGGNAYFDTSDIFGFMIEVVNY